MWDHYYLKLQRTFFTIFTSYRRKVFGTKGKQNISSEVRERAGKHPLTLGIYNFNIRVTDNILNDMKVRLLLSRIVWLSRKWQHTSRAYGIRGNGIVFVHFFLNSLKILWVFVDIFFHTRNHAQCTTVNLF